MMAYAAARRGFFYTLARSLGLALSVRGNARRASSPASHRAVYDVTDFGASGDGKTVETVAIKRAIAAAAEAGGGTVSFPAGRYLSYSIRLESNVGLQLG